MTKASLENMYNVFGFEEFNLMTACYCTVSENLFLCFIFEYLS